MEITDGYIFINSEGQYAMETNGFGFSSNTKMLCWTSELNRTATPWSNMAHGKHCGGLRYMQPLQATSTRKVTIGVWKQEEPQCPAI